MCLFLSDNTVDIVSSSWLVTEQGVRYLLVYIILMFIFTLYNCALCYIKLHFWNYLLIAIYIALCD